MFRNLNEYRLWILKIRWREWLNKNKEFKINHKLDGIKNDFSDFMRRMPYSDLLNQINKKYIKGLIIITKSIFY